MVQFRSLRLSGFKSFVDSTELLINEGMTGIVGPNGCGKSNLVEALRWVMGENSAKRMRGGEMDDVIFAGTSSRPSRNLADVTLMLDNKDRGASAQFNDHDELEVVRRITRGQGSNYRVNGKEVRAKDVQLLFADLASGAQSTAMVSQGRVGAIINAKPKDRRGLLEEAAGITGLHSRRHETELRLRAAETNLERLDDVIATMEAQLQGLKKQARQATRYRNINAQIRCLEAILLHLEAEEGKSQTERAETLLREADAAVALCGEQTATTAAEQAEAAAALPDLRQAEAEAAAALQKLLIDRDSLDREIERAKNERQSAEARLEQTRQDRARAQANLRDGEAALTALAAEEEALAAAESTDLMERDRIAADRDQTAADVDQREEELACLTEQVAADESRSRSLNESINQLETRIAKLKSQQQQLSEQRGTLEQQLEGEDRLLEANAALESEETKLAERRQALEEAQGAYSARREESQESESFLRVREEAVGQMRAEASALTQLLEIGNPEMWPPLVDAIKVTSGYETALGAALGDDLTASADEAAPVHWETLPPFDPAPSLPEGALALSAKVEAPAVLARRLSQIGVVKDIAEGNRLQSSLKPGQRLVTQDGALWRWDGFAAKADAPTASALRLTQRNRLDEIERDRAIAEKALKEAKEQHAAKVAAADQAMALETEARKALEQQFSAIDQARKSHGELAQKMAALRSRLGVLGENESRLAGELSEAEERLEAASLERERLPDLVELRAKSQSQRIELSERRTILTGLQGQLERLLGEAKNRATRVEAISRERQSWQDRLAASQSQATDLLAREESLRSEIEVLTERPGALTAKREELAEAVETAAELRKTAGDDLARGETRQSEADKALREAEQTQASARETRVRAEAGLEQAREKMTVIGQKVREKLACPIDQILAIAEIDPEQPLPAHDDAEVKVQKLERERENIGPVNLRAEAEAEELNQQIIGLQDERGDLVSAIAKLRQAIGRLNRESRERLLEAFEKVNAHFSELFVRLFGGGRAYLQLTDAEDPLEAGLEIMASPPGKRLQVMSLLSGGEQALTALSLLFAVFLTNPAPICVLDEVDAPLDDANVDRLCSLLTELCRRTATRFVLITHHRMTMARVDRLYGVTMAERGVSQLVSVDLETAASLRETA